MQGLSQSVDEQATTTGKQDIFCRRSPSAGLLGWKQTVKEKFVHFFLIILDFRKINYF